MTSQQCNDYCRALAATSHVVQWGGADVWKVGGKVFAVCGWGDENQPACTFKVCDLDFEILSGEPGFRPAPYFAARGMKWIQCIDLEQASDEQIQYYLRESHRLVSLGLSKKLQKELGLNQ